MMTPPFTRAQFFEVFGAYNTAVWPMQVVLTALALAVVLLAVRARPGNGRWVLLALALLWLWMGVVYHWIYFARINPAARIFGAAFLVQGALLGYLGLRAEERRFEPTVDVAGWAGGVLMAYALLLYPLIGWAVGRAYPEQPTFGLPCPTTIFTIGVLLWARPRLPWAAWAVPVLWSLIGATAVRYFGVMEDAMLPLAGVVGLTLTVWRTRPGGRAAGATPFRTRA